MDEPVRREPSQGPVRARGRGTRLTPANRFGQTDAQPDLEQVESDTEYLDQLRNLKTEYQPDASRSLISENDSPDIPFRFSLNPYRGCLHGCSYCYARPTHEYLGLNAGLDFETRISFKENAPQLLRDWLNRPDWDAQTIMMSGITDCYQPVEKDLRLTRQCLEVMLEARQPVAIITKNALVTRDLDILSEMARMGIVRVAVSLTTLDQTLTQVLEPRSSSPLARLRALRELNAAQVPTHAMLAPIVPGLTDSEIPALLQAASEAGAVSAGYQLLRLPMVVQTIFIDWLHRERPAAAERVESRIRATRDGQLTASEFGKRMGGTGEIAKQIHRTFDVFARRCGLLQKTAPLETSQFRPPKSSNGQLRLF